MSSLKTQTAAPRSLAARLLAVLVVVIAGVGVTAAVQPSAGAATLLPAPTGLKAVRDAGNVNDFTISWNPVDDPALHHYNVSVYQNGVDDVQIVPAGTNSLHVTGSGLDVTYRITVGTRDVAGEGTTTGYYWLYPVIPGSVLGLSASRNVLDATTGSVSWNTPTRPGYGPITQYNLLVTRMSDGVVIVNQQSMELTAALTALDPARMYSVKVSAQNAYGIGPVSTTTIGNTMPGTPTGLVAVRNADNPNVVHLTWVAPLYAGFSAITHYQVVYGIGSLTTTEEAAFPLRSDVVLDASRVGLAAVRACNSYGCSYISPVVSVPVSGAPITAAAVTTNPKVLVEYANGVIDVQTVGIIGSTSTYPRLVVRIAPSIDNGGFADTQWGQNGASLLKFGIVPSGNFMIIVNGVSSSGVETELARKVVVTESFGTLESSEMQVVSGTATIVNGEVNMSGPNDNIVFSTRTKNSMDMVVRTKATLSSGSGYGVWVRAGLDSLKRRSGLQFAYDPVNAKAFVLRQWHQNKECASPLAKKALPAGFNINGEHEIVVFAKGAFVWATVDGVEMIRVSNLSAAIKASPCAFPNPQGKAMGLRAWGGNVVRFRNIEFN